MAELHEMETDRLVGVIQAIQLGRKTGVLVVRRGEGINREEGVITFVNGRAQETQLGRHRGTEAFNLLCLWEHCSFLFKSANPQDELVFSTTSQAPSQIPQMSPASEADASVPFIPISPLRARATSPPPSNTGAQEQQTIPEVPPVVVIPYQSRQLNSALRIIENMHLSRMHRQTFLLIDGQRSSVELARLTGRSPAEMLKILQDLQRVAVIQMRQ